MCMNYKMTTSKKSDHAFTLPSPQPDDVIIVKWDKQKREIRLWLDAMQIYEDMHATVGLVF